MLLKRNFIALRIALNCWVERIFMDYLKKYIGKKIKEARKLSGFKTQNAFADSLGTDTGTVGRWEAGIYSPSPDFWKKIESLTGKPKIWFQTVDKDSSLDLAKAVSDHAGELRQKRLESISWELDLSNDDPADNDFLKKLLPVLPYLKNIPPDILAMLTEQDEVYFNSLRRVLVGLKEARSQKPKKHSS